jgi:RimJ/RimL family protein N-acetyltransferase
VSLQTRLQQRGEVGRFIGRLGSPPLGASVFTVLREDAQIGQVGLVKSSTFDGSDYELFCALLPEAEGRGYATEACRRILTWAFETMPLSRVLACVDASNLRSAALVRRLGMIPLGPRPYHDEIVYELSRQSAT